MLDTQLSNLHKSRNLIGKKTSHPFQINANSQKELKTVIKHELFED